MDCDRLRKLVLRFIDGELDGDGVVTVRSHVSSCPHCATFVEITRKVRVVIRQRCGREQAPESLRLRILAQMPHRRGTRRPDQD